MPNLYICEDASSGIWAAPCQNLHNAFVTRMDPDQPAYPHSLIRVCHTVCSEQHGSWSDCADAKAGLDPCWSQTNFVGFVMARLIWRRQPWVSDHSSIDTSYACTAHLITMYNISSVYHYCSIEIRNVDGNEVMGNVSNFYGTVKGEYLYVYLAGGASSSLQY
jgi:hypothetical protein